LKLIADELLALVIDKSQLGLSTIPLSTRNGVTDQLCFCCWTRQSPCQSLNHTRLSSTLISL